MTLMKCLCCEKELPPVMQEDDCYQPHDAMVCNSRGNYGSCVFDPLEGGKELLFFVCDRCLVAKREVIYMIITRRKEKIVPAVNRLVA